MIKKILYDFEIPKKYTFIRIGTAGTFIGILSIILFSNIISENIFPKRIKIAAGEKTGESYVISQAIAKVVADKTNIDIDVCETDGTDDNLRAIEGKELSGAKLKCQSGDSTVSKVDLATAQADRLSSSMPVRSVARLYEDNFQLLIKPEKFGIDEKNFQPEGFNLSSLQGKTIGTPKGGGQRQSLSLLARNLGFSPFRNLDIVNTSDVIRIDQEFAAVFYVRSLGNDIIRQLISRGWRLIPIENVSVLRNKGFYYYKNSKIPQSNYQAFPPVPQEELKTIAVERLLLAQKDAPDWVIKKIYEVLDKHQKDIEDEIKNKAIASLARNFTKPDDNIDVQIHSGVDAYYESKKEPEIIEKADFIALLITIATLAWTIYVSVKNLRVNRQIKEVINVIKQPSDRTNQLNESFIKSQLEKSFEQHEKVDKIFQKASTSLDSEGFRAFSEAYKSTREIIERRIESEQRKLSSYYVQELVNLIDSEEDPNEILGELEKKFINISRSLLEHKIFSRESFRTFTEAYDIAVDTIERKKREKLQEKSGLNGSN